VEEVAAMADHSSTQNAVGNRQHDAAGHAALVVQALDEAGIPGKDRLS